MKNEKAPTLHQRILEEIEDKIMSGEWRPGTRIPFETELAESFGCSRMTVNKVMTQLAKAGLIERHRRSGSFVAQPHVQSAVMEIHDIAAEVRSLGLNYGYELIRARRRQSGSRDKWLKELDGPAQVIDLLAIHNAGTTPFCLEERRINASVVSEARKTDFALVPPGPWLVAQVPWTSAEHRVSASSATQAEAGVLRIAEGAACLVIERQTWHLAKPLTWARFVYPGKSHSVVARFNPPSG